MKQTLLLSVVLFFGLIGTVEGFALKVTEDTYVGCQFMVGDKRGFNEELKISSDHCHGTYLKFDISTLKEVYTRPIETAKLRLYIIDIVSSGGMTVYAINPQEWNEETLEFIHGVQDANDLISIGSLYLDKDKSKTDKDSFIFIDITDGLKGALESENDTFSVYLAPTDDGTFLEVILDSKDIDPGNTIAHSVRHAEIRPAHIDIEFVSLEQGETGDQGLVGEPGLTGAAGQDGPTGAPGQDGPTGLLGPAGPTGAPGDNGPQGGDGPQGYAGPMGPIGPTGGTNLVGLCTGTDKIIVERAQGINYHQLTFKCQRREVPRVVPAKNNVNNPPVARKKN